MMKSILPIFLLAVLLAACGSPPTEDVHMATMGGASVFSFTAPLTRETKSLSLDGLSLGQPGEFAVADVLTYLSDKATITAPAGWTLIRDDGAMQARQSLYWHVIRAQESGAETWTFSESIDAQGAVLLLKNISMASPVDASSGNLGGGATPIARSVTTLSDGDLILFFFATDWRGPGLSPQMPMLPSQLAIMPQPERRTIPNISRIVDRSVAVNAYWVDAAYQTTKGKTPDAMCILVQLTTTVAAQVALRRVPPQP